MVLGDAIATLGVALVSTSREPPVALQMYASAAAIHAATGSARGVAKAAPLATLILAAMSWAATWYT